MEYQDELLRFCDKKLPPDYRERFFFFYRHHPRETAIQPTATFLLKRILDTTRDLMAELDLNILVRKILHLMLEVTRTDRGFVILLADTEPVISYTHKMDTRSIKNEEESDAISWTLTKQALADRKPLMTIDALGDERFAETRSVQRLQLQSIVILPFLFRGEVMGAVYLDSRLKSEQLKKDDLPYLEALADQIGIALHNAREFGKAEAQLNQAKKTLDRQERELHFRYSYKNFLGRSEKILAVFELLDRVIDTPVPILLRGESGTGKEMIAKIIHYNSRRQGRQMVSINCGAIPATLLESELFGHVKGSFTGAFENKTGLFEQADGGTLFLDEIGDMPFDMQVKLLRALQDMTIRPVGATHDKKVDVRVICATHRPIEEMIREKKFREDLFYRINTAEIVIPPLRERREDIPLLISHFLEEWAKQPGGRKKQIDADALACLTEQTWPGNVRQLENTLYNLCVFSEAERITLKEVEARKDLFDGSGSPAVLPPSQFPADTTPDDLAKAIDERKITLPEAKQAFEKKQILRVLKLHEGRVGKAAEHLQMPRPQVSRLIKRYQIEK
ncbi:MAG: sigma 54-interacting transcriptional regulator [Deltaproteobacteria bacterium]|nr:sigma 54-interacting transcriptional regulator [Deltaproteobacteria bacterium]